MRRRPHIVLDDFFVKDSVVAATLDQGGAAWTAEGDYLEVPSGSPFAGQLLASTHAVLRRWVRAPAVQVTYSGWLYNAHLAVIAAVAARYVSGLTTTPLARSLGSPANICLLLVLSYHVAFFAALNYRPAWFERTVVFHSPFAWAAIWLLVFAGDDPHAASGTGGPVRSQLDRRVGPLALLLMHCFVWYARRTVIGVTVFECKIRASTCAHWIHRLYSVLAALAIVLAWKTLTYASAVWDRHHAATPAGGGSSSSSGGGQCRDSYGWMGRRGIVGLARLGAAMLVSGGTHALWYSFISYAYHLIVWKEYLRDGLAVWVVGDSAMCTKLY
ncbi:hypothetical protein IWQ56_000212 [Coemansia nantahalensis]|nr:hypothetical protein IWQ56_000212 [Coemansia nantahalensis]